MSAEQSIGWTSGEDVIMTMTVDATTAPSGISGWTFAFYVVSPSLPTTRLITKTSGSGISILVAADRTLTITIPAADSALTPGSYSYQVFRTNSGSRTKLAHGSLEVDDDFAD